MSSRLMNLMGIIFAVYLAVGGAMVIAGYRKVGDILIPVIVLLIALCILPTLTVTLLHSAFKVINPWWIIGLCVLLLIGIYFRK